MNADARAAVARAFKEVLSRRHPGLAFSVPDVRAQPEATSGAGKVSRSLTAPEHKSALLDRDPSPADENDIEACLK